MARPYVQMQIDFGEGWRVMGRQTIDDPPGSAADVDPVTGHRDVIVFGWDHGSPGVWRSVGGVDEEIGEARVVFALSGLEMLSDLRVPFERDMRSPYGRTYRARWSLGA